MTLRAEPRKFSLLVGSPVIDSPEEGNQIYMDQKWKWIHVRPTSLPWQKRKKKVKPQKHRRQLKTMKTRENKELCLGQHVICCRRIWKETSIPIQIWSPDLECRGQVEEGILWKEMGTGYRGWAEKAWIQLVWSRRGSWFENSQEKPMPLRQGTPNRT